MLLKTRGIIIRSTKFGESSLILDIYTLHKGRQSFVINSVRSAKARVKQSLVSLSSLVDLVVYHRDNKSLNRIKEIKSASIYSAIPFNVIKGTVALFMVELIEKTVKEAEENTSLYHFIEDSFLALDEAKKTTLFPLMFPILLMSYLGFSPGNNWSLEKPYFDIRESLFVKKPPHIHFLSPELSQIFSSLLRIEINDLEAVQISKQERSDLLDGILNYYKYHVENFKELNSHLVLREVLG